MSSFSSASAIEAEALQSWWAQAKACKEGGARTGGEGGARKGGRRDITPN